MSKKQFLFDVVDILESLNIKYAVYAGIFLGLIREKGFIKHDRDVDIVVYEQFWCNYPIMRKFLKKMVDKNISIISLWNNLDFNLKSVHVPMNISYLACNDKEYYKYTNQGRGTFPLECFDKLEQHEFLGKKMWFPSNPEKYFVHVYGKDWKTLKETKVHLNYTKESFKNKIQTKINFKY